MGGSAATTPVAPYLPFYRRLVLRTSIAWLVLRVFVEGARLELERDPVMRTGAADLHPLGALLLIGLVLAMDAINARALRESLFRRNAGIRTTRVLLVAGAPLVLLELLFRAVR